MIKRALDQVILASLVSIALLNGGCKKAVDGDSTLVASNASKEVNLAIWTNYVTPEILADFESQTGLKVNVSNYSSNEELLAKLQAGAEGYDVAVPSDYMVVVMKQLGLLQAIDLTKVQNRVDLDPRVMKQYYDPQNELSLPFSWGTVGIAVNTKAIKSPIVGWKDLFENKELTGRFTLLDDVREALGAALKSHSKSFNSKNSEDLALGKQTLIELKKKVKGFTSETMAGLVNGEMMAAHAYSVDALMASHETKGLVQYVIPQEGCTFWVDNLVIPKGAKNKDGAYKLIDFLLSAKVGAARAQRLYSAPSNQKAMDLIPQALKDNRGLFPDPSVLKKCEMLEDLGDAMVQWDRIWTEVKAH